MEIVSVGRGGGKTYRYLEYLAKDPNAVMVVMGDREAMRVREELLRVYLQVWGKDVEDLSISDISKLNMQIVPVSRSNLRGRKVSTLFVDNLDIILHDMFGHRVTSASMSEPVTFKTQVPIV